MGGSLISMLECEHLPDFLLFTHRNYLSYLLFDAAIQIPALCSSTRQFPSIEQVRVQVANRSKTTTTEGLSITSSCSFELITSQMKTIKDM
jgi:hypothetical protein